MTITDPPAFTLEQILSWLDSSEAIRRASPWMTPQQTAGYLGISLGTLRNWTCARFVPFSRRGRVVRYHRDTAPLSPVS